MATTQVTRHLNAPRSEVYAARLDGDRIPLWRVPQWMTCVVHEFEAFEGGWQQALAGLAELVESPDQERDPQA